MAQITHYMVHDPVGNTESYLTEFDAEFIARAAAANIVSLPSTMTARVRLLTVRTWLSRNPPTSRSRS